MTWTCGGTMQDGDHGYTTHRIREVPSDLRNRSPDVFRNEPSVRRTMSTPDETILDRIRKLLRLADPSRGATEHEARAAMAKAQELMTRYSIDSALLQRERGARADSVLKNTVDLPKTLNPADLLILGLLQRHFRVRVILGRTGSGTPTDIIGTAADVEFAVFAFHFLRRTFFGCWNSFKRTLATADRASFYRGLRDGLEAALREGSEKAEQTCSEAERGVWAVAVAGRTAAITAYVAENYGRIVSRTSRARRVDSSSYRAGEAKGRTIRISRPIGASSTQP